MTIPMTPKPRAAPAWGWLPRAKPPSHAAEAPRAAGAPDQNTGSVMIARTPSTMAPTLARCGSRASGMAMASARTSPMPPTTATL